MSISAPRYSTGPLPRLGRGSRVWAVAIQEFSRRTRGSVIAPVMLAYVAVVTTTVFFVFFTSLIGTVTSATYTAAVSTPIWPYLLLIVTATAGAGSVAEDVGSGAIALYLSRPIRRLDYLAAKTVGCGSWILFAALGPGLVAVVITAVLGYASSTIAVEAAAGFLAVGLLATGFFTCLAIALSSLTNRALYAGVTIFGLVLTLDIGASLVSGISGNSEVLYADPISNLLAVAHAAFGVPGNYPIDPATSAVILIVSGVALWAFAGWRMGRVRVITE
jgi:ABC-type transport system involved in multi-copper enzyme maturation permease subunit